MTKPGYLWRFWGAMSVIVGAIMLAEHIYRFYFDLDDPIGHDWLGLGLILFGVALGIIGYLLHGKKGATLSKKQTRRVPITEKGKRTKGGASAPAHNEGA